MRLTFLGTAAAEGYPALWCRCQRCQTARRRGGKNLRFRAAALINDDLLIDPGPDIVAAAVRLGTDLAPVQACLITHPHTDHLEASTFFWRRKGFVATGLPELPVYGSQASMERMLRLERRDIDPTAIRVQPRPIGAFQHFQIETGGELPVDPRFGESDAPVPLTPPRSYSVWTFAASHAEPAIEPMIFAVRQDAGPEVSGGSKTLLYSTDTGPYSDETWTALERLGADGIRFDITAIDSTSGLGPDSKGHMNIRQMAWHQDELRRRGLLSERCQRYAHHFSHNGTPPFEELEPHLAALGVSPSYDGLVVSA
ncbi:MAG TPA: MBL fold metallo-hydrolase [Chloroflexota bacterium]|nr:MBL fold metallo-hydrolase [Chloroflexota bacterium]